MSDQRQHTNLPDETLRPQGGGDANAGSARTSAARAELNQLYAAADAIMERIRLGDSTRFLEHMQQSGGQ